MGFDEIREDIGVCVAGLSHIIFPMKVSLPEGSLHACDVADQSHFSALCTTEKCAEQGSRAGTVALDPQLPHAKPS